MREQVGAIATQGEHQQQLGIHARGRDVLGREARNGGKEGISELHENISPQRTRRHTEEAIGE
jgi:hypothetical protein